MGLMSMLARVRKGDQGRGCRPRGLELGDSGLWIKTELNGDTI